MAADALYQAANSLLATCEGILAATAAGVPSRVFIHNGDVPFDCPTQLTVHTGSIERAQVSPSSAPLDRSQVKFPQVIRALLVVTCLRAVPLAREANDTIILPATADVDASAATQMIDGWALFEGVHQAHRAGTLHGPGWRSYDVGPAAPVATSGQAGGWQLPVLISIDADL